jgi:hypothetical protein
MKISANWIRLRIVWLAMPAFYLLARPEPTWLEAGLVVALTGTGLRAWASGTIRKNVVLAVSGPYAFTRNPLYLGSFLVGLGLTIGAGLWYLVAIYVVGFAGLYGWKMKLEERLLAERFGEPFREYAAEVPLFLPRVRPYRQPGGGPAARDGGFRLQQYLRHREYNVLLGIGLGFLALVLKLLWGSPWP